MQAIIEPGNVYGTITPPASKSMMQRVCAAALLHTGKTIVHNPGTSNDDKAALSIIEQLGAKLQYHNDYIEIVSNGIAPIADTINCHESGLSARMFTPIAALTNKAITINGSGTLLNRSMTELANILPQAGVSVETTGGRLPLHIKGPLLPVTIRIDGSQSSQYLSGLLFAFSYAVTLPVIIEVTNLTSRPYIDMTLEVLQTFGKRIVNDSYTRFIIDPANFESKGDVELTIEADWSGAAFWCVAAAIAGEIKLNHMNMDSAQADKAIINILEATGTCIHNADGVLTIKSPDKLLPFDFDATNCPDLFPPLAVLASYCNGDSTISGVHRLFDKESNRVASITDMLYQFGVTFSVEDDILTIEGKHKLEAATVDSYNDHRIAMATAIAALRAQGACIIEQAEAVSKSYPRFFSDLSSLGVKCTLT